MGHINSTPPNSSIRPTGPQSKSFPELSRPGLSDVLSGLNISQSQIVSINSQSMSMIGAEFVSVYSDTFKKIKKQLRQLDLISQDDLNHLLKTFNLPESAIVIPNTEKKGYVIVQDALKSLEEEEN